MSTQNDITKLLDIQELIVVDIEIKENEVIMNCNNRFNYSVCMESRLKGLESFLTTLNNWKSSILNYRASFLWSYH